MPFYHIKIMLPDGSMRHGIRKFDSPDIIKAKEHFSRLAKAAGSVHDIEITLYDRIPVEFMCKGAKVSGELSLVSGAGTAGVYQLMANKWFYGRLRKGHMDQWVFDSTPKTKELEALADYFGKCVEEGI